MVNHYYIDGYNVIHHSRELRSRLDGDLEVGRQALIDLTAEFCGQTGERVTIVFDGQSTHTDPPGPVPGVPGLHVVYAPAHLSADALIERAVYEAKDRMATVAVTSDHGIRDLCSGLGSLVMSAANFLETLRRSRSENQAASQPPRRGQSSSSLGERISQDQADGLERLKKRLEGG
jgi:predicted RNA-binding protein with PIN domain